MATEEKNRKSKKVLKNIEVVSIIGSEIDSFKARAQKGERIRVTPFAESIMTANESHPHVNTVKGKLMEAYFWQEALKGVKLIRDAKKDAIMEIEFTGDEDGIEDKLDKILEIAQNISKSLGF